jgi:hypothetical protein
LGDVFRASAIGCGHCGGYLGKISATESQKELALDLQHAGVWD